MSWEFVPFVGYGPIRFGISQSEAIELLGPPSKAANMLDTLDPYIDHDVLGPARIDRLKRSTFLSFADTESNSERPSLGFFDGALVDIHMQKLPDSLIASGVNLAGRNRVQIIVDLSQKEEVVLFSGSDYYFESIGVRITAPKFWKESGSISLYSKDGFENEMESSEPYEYAPEEITGKES